MESSLPRSIVLRFCPTPGIALLDYPIPDVGLVVGDGQASDSPGCIAPWAAFGEVLARDGLFVGLGYEVRQMHAYARTLVESAGSEAALYLPDDSADAEPLYDTRGQAYVEMRISPIIPDRIMTSEGIDGFWFLNSDNSALIAFGICDIDRLLRDHNLKLGPLQPFGPFVPMWTE